MQTQQTRLISSFQKRSLIQTSVASPSALEIHARAIEVSTCYKRAEAELLDVLDQVDRRRVFLEFGATSLYAYCVGVLKLSESVTYNLIAVMRKSREVPELREQSKAGIITLSNARRVAAVLTPQNKSEWLERACTMSARQLEKEISKVLPGAATREHATYVSPHRIKLELGLSESEMLKFRKVQDQISQARQKSVSLEETLIELMNFYLARKCPVEKARRHMVKKGLNLSTAAPGDGETREVTVQAESPLHARASKVKRDTRVLRTPIPAKILHSVNLRDQRKCQYRFKSTAHMGADEKRKKSPRASGVPAPICGQTRFLEVHHRLPLSAGGTPTVENLITFCSHHHEWIHSAIARQPDRSHTGALEDATSR